MELLGGYGSDGSGSGDEEQSSAVVAIGGGDTGPLQAAASSQPPSSEGSGPDAASTKRKIDYAKLPVKRPLQLDTIAGRSPAGSPDSGDGEAEPPLKKAAELEDLRLQLGKSLVASLPPPKASALGSERASFSSGSMRIDLSGVKKSKDTRSLDKEAAGRCVASFRGGGAPEVAETEELPASALNHPMFGAGLKLGPQKATVPDGPSAQDLESIRKGGKFVNIHADDMKDPNWYINNQISGGPGLHKGKTVADEQSMYEGVKWRETTHANPNKTQKRKHQINWLAQEAMDMEAEMLDRGAQGRLSKAQTSAKYGW